MAPAELVAGRVLPGSVASLGFSSLTRPSYNNPAPSGSAFFGAAQRAGETFPVLPTEATGGHQRRERIFLAVEQTGEELPGGQPDGQPMATEPR